MFLPANALVASMCVLLCLGSVLHAADAASPQPEPDVEGLIKIIQDDEQLVSNREAVARAMETLAASGDPRAALVIARRQDWKRNEGPIQTTEPPPPERIFPAVAGLLDIGRAAAPAVVYAVSEQDRDETFINNAGYVLITYYRSNREVREFILISADAYKEAGLEDHAARARAFAEAIPEVGN